MAAILVFLCLIAKWPLWPRSRLNILLNILLKARPTGPICKETKKILKWWPFENKVYSTKKIQFIARSLLPDMCTYNSFKNYCRYTYRVKATEQDLVFIVCQFAFLGDKEIII